MKDFFGGLTRLVLILTAIIAALYIWARFIEPSKLKVTQLDIKAQSLPASAHGLKIALFSDTHLGFGYDKDDLAKAVGRINEQEPDVIVFTGDLFDNYSKWNGKDKDIIAVLSKLDARLGKFAVLGNHDYESGANRITDDILTQAGFDVLYNEAVLLPGYSVSVFGIDDCAYGKGSGSVFTPQPGCYNVVLCHEPDIFDDVHGADLMLSGHTHGGQVRPPFMDPPVLPKRGRKYAEGLYGTSDSQLFVTRGLGMTIMKLRFCESPEIAVLKLT